MAGPAPGDANRLPMSDLYVSSPAALANFCAQLHGHSWLALDTEFVRESTYYPQLCLVQVASENLLACIDPLALADLEPLLELLYDPRITKILHAARQDLEIFFHLRGLVPSPVFDTQLAATLLGQGNQIGYATLVRELLDVELDKSQSRTDWSHRPLEPAQLKYAADDVRYLPAIYHQQHTALAHLKRLTWLTEDCEALCEPAGYAPHPHELWKRVKGGQQLRGVQLATLRALASWREAQASTENRPRRWVLSDDMLVELARCMPTNWQRLERVRGLKPDDRQRYGKLLLEIIKTARSEPSENWPWLTARERLQPEQEALVDAMMAVVRLHSLQNTVESHVLASRKDLEQLLRGALDVPLLHGWRAALVGRELQALLRGELCLEAYEGELRIAPTKMADCYADKPK